MNFKEWSKKYYPDEDEEILHKMSHAWASAHVNMISSEKKQANAIDIVGQELSCGASDCTSDRERDRHCCEIANCSSHGGEAVNKRSRGVFGRSR